MWVRFRRLLLEGLKVEGFGLRARAKARVERPQLAASKVRKTTKVWTAMQVSFEEAMKHGPSRLEECVREYESEEQARIQDVSFKTMEIRNPDGLPGRPSEEHSRESF